MCSSFTLSHVLYVLMYLCPFHCVAHQYVCVFFSSQGFRNGDVFIRNVHVFPFLRISLWFNNACITFLWDIECKLTFVTFVLMDWVSIWPMLSLRWMVVSRIIERKRKCCLTLRATISNVPNFWQPQRRQRNPSAPFWASLWTAWTIFCQKESDKHNKSLLLFFWLVGWQRRVLASTKLVNCRIFVRDVRFLTRFVNMVRELHRPS